MLKSAKGFSLVELLIAVVIVAIVAAIAMWGSSSIKNYRLTSASKQLYGDLQKVRVDAMTKSTGTLANSRGRGIRFDSTTAYTLFEFNDANNNFNYDSGEAANTRQVALSGGITIQRNPSGSSLVNPTGSASASDNEIIIYDKHGIVRDTSWSLVAGGTYVLAMSEISNKRCVVITTIRIREGSWNATTRCTIQ